MTLHMINKTVEIRSLFNNFRSVGQWHLNLTSLLPVRNVWYLLLKQISRVGLQKNQAGTTTAHKHTVPIHAFRSPKVTNQCMLPD